jgi:beta-galactosidase GanA
MRIFLTALSISLTATIAFGQTAPTEDDFPHLQQVGHIRQFFVDGHPFIIFGGQVGNGTGFPDRMAAAIPKLLALHANSVEFPVYWGSIEPTEGQFDFSSLDQIIGQLRAAGLRGIPLWFGTYKNGAMDYVPTWVKSDTTRFPRVIDAAGNPIRVLSPHGQATLDADCKAFAALMAHLKQIDSDKHTIILVQVENESGLLGSPRDFSAAGTKLFQDPVPPALVSALNKQPGIWTDVFGSRMANEAFAAWSVASYINTVAAAGKAEYALPMYVNCWMGGTGTNDRFTEFDRPGDSYPSGGPVSQMLDVWKAAAPNIDVIGPDIYHQSPIIYRTILSRYTRPDNPLMVVETGPGMVFARYCFYALGDFSAIGFTPFGIDNGPGDDLSPRFADMANNFRVLGSATQAIAQLQSAGKLQAAVEEDAIPGKMLYFDHYDILVRFRPPVRNSGQPLTATGASVPSGRVLVGELSPDEFLIAGFDAALDFKPSLGSPFTGAQFLKVEAGRYDQDQWTPTRQIVGNLTDGGLPLPSDGTVIRAKLMRY